MTPVRCGRFIVEVGGRVELGEVEAVLKEVAKKLPLPAKVVSRERERDNQNPWTFKQVVQGNMLGIRKVLSPYEIKSDGRFTGKFYLPWRV